MLIPIGLGLIYAALILHILSLRARLQVLETYFEGTFQKWKEAEKKLAAREPTDREVYAYNQGVKDAAETLIQEP